MFSLLTLLDDVATTLDDVAVMTKVAMQKTTALMSDDLAVNAGVVDGVNPDRELPIVKAIFLGSLVNKLICIVSAMIILAVYPPLLRWILIMGGIYLCYEGAHKVWEKVTGHHEASKKSLSEKEKIKGAIKTDLILSIEIIVIAKTAVSGTFIQQTISLLVVGIAASILIYGLVALLVKMDDFGLFLIKKGYQKIGSKLVYAMPLMMKGLGILGTMAMFLVGGGIFNHQFHLPFIIPELLQNLFLGLIIGIISLTPFLIVDKFNSN